MSARRFLAFCSADFVGARLRLAAASRRRPAAARGAASAVQLLGARCMPARPARAPRPPLDVGGLPKALGKACRLRSTPYLARARVSAARCWSRRYWQLLAIELDQDLAGAHAVAQIGQHTRDLALGLRGDGDISSAASVPTSSIGRRMSSARTASAFTLRAPSLLACALDASREQAVAIDNDRMEMTMLNRIRPVHASSGRRGSPMV